MLVEISKKLDLFIAIQKLVNAEQIENAKEKIFKSGTKKKIYELCDGKRAVSDIVKAVFPNENFKKVQPTISYHLADLENLGLIASKIVGGKKFFYKVL